LAIFSYDDEDFLESITLNVHDPLM
jgi:hypothetical protein